MNEPAIGTTTETPAPDFAAFEASENAKALGQAEPPPPSEPEPQPEPEPEPKAAPIDASGKDHTPANGRSRRTAKDQEFINERIRTSVADATAALQKELADLKAKAAPAAEPAPAAAPPVEKPEKFAFPDFDKHLETNPTATYPEWEIDRLIAFNKWIKAQDVAESAATQQKTRDDEAASALQTRIDAWAERRDAFAAANPGFAEKVGPMLDALHAGTMFGDAILESDVGPQMALHLVDHPEEVERIARLSPNSAIRALGKIEALYETTSASALAGPAAKTVSSAPAPPTTLAARSASPADPVRAAVERGDYRAFEEEENRRATASR